MILSSRMQLSSIIPQNKSIDAEKAASDSSNETVATFANDKDIGLVEHKEYSQTETPTQELLNNSFISEISMIESVSSETNQSFDDSKPNNTIHGKYGKKTFDLSMDILPMVNIKDVESKIDDNEHYEQWKELPNVVNASSSTTKVTNNTVKLNTENKYKSVANDSFLCNIAKEIEKLDEELSSMGLLTNDNSIMITMPTNSVHSSSDIEHDEEEKMEILLKHDTKHNQLQEIDMNKDSSLTQKSHEENQENQENDNITIIKDKLSLLRKSMVFKKKSVLIPLNEEEQEKEKHEQESSVPKTPIKTTRIDDNITDCQQDELGEFATKKHKDAFFDPLVSPPMDIKDKHLPQINDKENCINYNEAIYHENATKIQNQWKKFQFKTILVNTFNRHLKQSQENNLPVTITDLIASTTHEIVDHAEKLFSMVHHPSNNKFNKHNKASNTMIGNFSYGQLHFYGSPALDWSSVYSMIESIVLRNLLYDKQSELVKKIFDNQKLLDQILSSDTRSNADNILIEQLTSSLIQLKSKLYQTCQNNIDCNINPLRLFPKHVNIFKSKSDSVDNLSVNDNASNSSKPELNAIKNQLTLLRKSFSQRRRNMHKLKCSIQSSPKLSSSLRTSVMTLSDEIDNLCNKKCDSSIVSENIPVNHCNISTSSKMFTFDDNSFSQCRPMTAPNPNTSIYDNITPGVITKKPFLKRKKRHKLSTKKVDWSYVKPKTISHLSEDVRASRNINYHRSDYKPNNINWNERVSSRVDCGNKSVSSNKKRLEQRKKQNSFRETYHNSIQTQTICRKDDDYLYYLKTGNKIGKITKESATAQLYDGSGPMILKSNSSNIENNDNNNDIEYDESMNEYECDDSGESADNQLRELQETFAAIENAMKQRRENQQLQTN